MWVRNLQTSMRAVSRAKAFSLINVIGLSIAFAFSYMILLIVVDDLTWDSFHDNSEDIYRVTKIWRKGEISHYATTPAALGPAIGAEISGIANVARFVPAGEIVVEAAGDTFSESEVAFADPSFMELFSFPMIIGDPDRALLSPLSALITRALPFGRLL